jgi:FtsP/CotA-like multicopper oxidase with cupredoxin domain
MRTVRYRTTISVLVAAVGLIAELPLAADEHPHSSPVATTVSADGPPVPEPQSIRPVEGVLDFTLTAKPARVTIAGRSVVSNVYNGMYIPPVLRLRRGDELRLKFVNEIGPSDIEIKKPKVSNVHYHGMAISPNQPADDPYMLVPPAGGLKTAKEGHHEQSRFEEHGKHEERDHEAKHLIGADIKPTNSFDYRWSVPEDHATGLFWYHPHPHGMTEHQVLSGMSGMLVIEDMVLNHYPELNDLKRRTFILKDIELPDAEDDGPKTKTINGVLGGVIEAVPGSFEIWEIGNLGADSYFDLALDGHKVWVIERDGNTLDRPEPNDHVFLPPASRARIVVEVGAKGLYGLRTREVDTGSDGDPNPDVVLATLKVAGQPAAADAARIRALLEQPPATAGPEGPTADEIAAMPVTRERTIEYTENNDAEEFYLNGKLFDPNRIDVEVKLGDVEEWTLINDTDERHTFHIHQVDFLVQSVNGNPLETVGVRDNVDIPFRDPKTKVPGVVKVKIPFTNPLIVGKFPFHCHILEHEDGGMMANVRVVRP